MRIFEKALATGPFEPIDQRLADLLWRQARRSGDEESEADLLAVSTALLSRERGRGHSCLHLAAWAERRIPTDTGPPLPPLPALAEWRQRLRASHLVEDGDPATPLVLDDGDRLYLYRYWRAERRLSENLLLRLSSLKPSSPPSDQVRTRFRQLFPEVGAAAETDWQAVAAASALAHPVLLVSGGPGTGKTTTVRRIVDLLLAAEPNLRIELAAPTGKAAARLGESLAEALSDPAMGEDRDRLPSRASTLHRLLGYQPESEQFRHRPELPLACDLLIVDEASMVDLLMMDAVLAALPLSSRLILLGDRDQLASVDTGFVFGDLCSAAKLNGFSPAFASFFQSLSGCPLPPEALGESEDSPGHRNLGVELRKNYRFQHQPGIGEVAAGIREQDVERVFGVFEDPRFPEVALDPPDAEAQALMERVRPHLEACLRATSVEEAFELLAALRILSPVRRGPWGVERLNLRVEQELRRLLQSRRELRGEGRDPRADPWYRGRPVLITAHDYQVRLFNCDLGVCWPENGRRRVWFAAPEGGLVPFPPARLPPHETAWAMTVHKSQGSELDQVVLALPEADSALLTRELFYTAVTRARRKVSVIATAERVRTTIERRNRRRSGLVEALSPGGVPEPLDLQGETPSTSSPGDDLEEGGSTESSPKVPEVPVGLEDTSSVEEEAEPGSIEDTPGQLSLF